MAERRDRAAKVAVGVGTATAIAAAALLARTAKAAAETPETPEGVVQLPKELWDLIIAMSASLENVDTDLDELVAAIQSMSLQVQGWPLNADGITSLRVAINPATGMALPYIAIPSGMTLFIKAWALNPGWLHVGRSVAECANVNQSFPLLPSETVWYQVENANQVYIAARAGGGGAPQAGNFACLTVEQKKGGA